MLRPTKVWRVAALAAAATLALAACGGSSGGTSGTSGGGGGAKTLTIATDQPLQGSSKATSDEANNAIKLYLEQVGNKAGKFKLKLKIYDDATAAKGAWDDATCAKNANDHVSNAEEVAVMGTLNSGCAKIEVPVLNQDPNGPMLMVSHANTNVGLTKTWEQGEPEKYYPTGGRNYARVVTTDDNQGLAASNFLFNELHKKNCYVLNDNQTYGQGLAQAFVTNAKKIGLNILGNAAWDAKATNYTALFQKIKATKPDCVFISGIIDNNGGQLLKDKVLGDNKTLTAMVPDGFEGLMADIPDAEDIYISFPALDVTSLRKNGGEAAKFLDAYKAKYGQDPASAYALYAAAAVQVIIKAIEGSDGTRKSINEQVFGGSGIVIPKEESLTGKEIRIDPKTGDTNNKDVSILQQVNKVENFVSAEEIK
jgi:branched-chain amino acid transport system substrate-binding protein